MVSPVFRTWRTLALGTGASERLKQLELSADNNLDCGCMLWGLVAASDVALQDLALVV